MLSMRSAVAGLVCFFAPWVATGASQASSLTPGEYLTNGGWGNLKISKVLGRQLSFAIWSNGANGHSCYLRGSILNGNQGVPEISVPDMDCRLLFREDKGAIDVTAYFGDRDRLFRRIVTVCAACDVARVNCNVVGHEGSMFFSFS